MTWFNTIKQFTRGDPTIYVLAQKQEVSLRGCIAEVIIYNTILSTASRNSVESYLKTKYAVP